MKNKSLIGLFVCVCLSIGMFSGCGERTGEKEYEKAMAAWKAGDLIRARSFLEKSIRKTTENEKKSVAWNQLGLILWELDEVDAAADAFVKSCRLTEELTDANLNMGIALFHAKRFDEAVLALNPIVGEHPDNRTAASILGLIEMQKKNWTGAGKILSKTVTAAPNDPAGQNALALAELHMSKNAEQAVKRLQQIQAAYPDYAPAIYNLAVIHDQWLNEKSRALTYYQDYIEVSGENGAYAAAAQKAVERLGGQPVDSPRQVRSLDTAQLLARGAKLLAEKEYTKAADQFRMAVQSDPKSKSAHYNLGHALFNLKQYQSAAESYINALKLDPRYTDARYMLAYSLVQLKQWNDAEREARELVKIDPERGRQMLDYISDMRKR